MAAKAQKPESRSRVTRGRSDSLAATIPCGVAFRVIAADCIAEFRSCLRAAQRGNADAVHRMRVALTRLQTAVSFFGPALDHRWMARCENALAVPRDLLGNARDADIAIQRGRPAGDDKRRWDQVRERKYDELRRQLSPKTTQALAAIFMPPAIPGSSPRARLQSISGPLAIFTPRRRDAWTRQLVKSARHLKDLGPRKLHRVRIKSKRLRYVLEWTLPIAANRDVRRLEKALKSTKRIHNDLGHLTDARAHRDYAKKEGLKPLPKLKKLGSAKAKKKTFKKVTRAVKRLGS